MRRWAFKRPVLGRLTWAWLGFGVAGLVGLAYLAAPGSHEKTPLERISLSVEDDLVRMAPPSAALRLSSPDPDTTTTGPAPLILEPATPPGWAADATRGKATRGEATAQAVQLPAKTVSFSENTPEDQDFFGIETRSVLEGPVVEPMLIAALPAGPPPPPPGDIRITIDGQDIDRPIQRETPKRAYQEVQIPDPVPALLQASVYGEIPAVAADGRRAATVYIRPAEAGDDEPAFALMVTGLGLDPVLTQVAIDSLPGPVALAFVPYAKNLDAQMRRARAAGHEIFLELPLEGFGPASNRSLGAAALLTGRSPAENLKRLDWLLSRGSGYFAVTNYQGAKFSADPSAIGPVLGRLKSLGVAYYDDTGAAIAVARRAGLPVHEIGDVLTAIPGDRKQAALLRRLRALADAAHTKSRPLAKVAATAESLYTLQNFLDGLTTEDAALAPPSSLLYRPLGMAP